MGRPPKKNKKQRVNFSMSPALYREAQNYARAHDRSLSEIVEQLLREEMGDTQPGQFTVHNNVDPVAQGPKSRAIQNLKNPASKSGPKKS
jgi:hypothetical protein